MMFLPPNKGPGHSARKGWRQAVAAIGAGVLLAGVGLAAPAAAGQTNAANTPAAGLSDPEVTSPDEVTAAVDRAIEAEGQDINVAPGDDAPADLDAVVDPASPGEVDNLDLSATPAQEVALDDPAGAITGWVSPALLTEEFYVAGVSWSEGQEPGRVLVRTADDNGWSEWFDVEAGADDGDAPDPGTAEAANSKAGTEPLVAPEATAIQVQVLSQPGADLPLGITPVVASGALPAGAAVPQTAPAQPQATAKPAIHLRTEWTTRKPGKFDPAPAKLSGAVLHHTAGANGTTTAQAPGVLRGIQNYHMDSRGWSDIGYNFVVDSQGGIWEARSGSLGAYVVGAHAAPYNTGSVGVSILGTYSSVEPPGKAVDAAGRLMAWRLSTSNVSNLKATVKYPGKTVAVPVVAGHRDVNSTDCPGNRLYAKLPTLRTYDASSPKPPPPPPPDPGPPPVTPFGQIMASPDMDRDGRGEVLGVDQVGNLYRYPMMANGKLGARAHIG
ncbi:MAG: N-acetylmuramoyl-L-alanine amidase, partial [Micrococcales bacterium]|nr:N-acetylmuramoyl-L-alanine amidase [Micrococcales bacterium]